MERKQQTQYSTTEISDYRRLVAIRPLARTSLATNVLVIIGGMATRELNAIPEQYSAVITGIGGLCTLLCGPLVAYTEIRIRALENKLNIK